MRKMFLTLAILATGCTNPFAASNTGPDFTGTWTYSDSVGNAAIWTLIHRVREDGKVTGHTTLLDSEISGFIKPGPLGFQLSQITPRPDGTNLMIRYEGSYVTEGAAEGNVYSSTVSGESTKSITFRIVRKQ